MSLTLNTDRPSGVRLLREELCAEVRAQLASAWGLPTSLALRRNPAPNPVPLLREHLPQLRKNDYVVGEKSDGVRYVLVLGRFEASGRPYAAMVNRSLDMHQLEVLADEAYFEGSVFDGELVVDRRGFLKFLCFDVVALRGATRRLESFTARYALLHKCFPSEHEREQPAQELADAGHVVVLAEPKFPLFACAKPFVNLCNLGSLLRSQQLWHDSDGFVFMPVRCPVLAGAHRTLFKFKPEPTVDTELLRGEHHCLEGDQRLSLREAFPEWSFLWEPGDAHHFDALEACIVESKVRLVSGSSVRLQFHRARHDKAEPNQRVTIRDVLRELQDHVQLDELLR